MTVTGTVDPGSVTVGSDTKPIKLVNRVATAVSNDLVSTGSVAQTVAGAKTFSGDCVFTDNRIRIASDSDKYLTIRKANNTTDTHSIAFYNTGLIGLYPGRETGKTKAVVIDGQRTYDATHTTDIVTIGTLQASTDVVHRSGDETIAGAKTFTQYMTQDTQWPVFIMKGGAKLDGASHADRGNIVWKDSDGNKIGELRFNLRPDNTTAIQFVVKNSDGTDKYVNIAEGDVIQ